MAINTTPYIIFEKMIADSLIDKGVFCTEWFDSCINKQRMSMYWNHGETPESACESLFFFAQAYKSKSISPTDPRICLGITRK